MDTKSDYISDFIYYIKICPKPIDAFPRNALHYELGKSWINFLTDYEFVSVDDKIMRNFYLWHLVACFEAGELIEPFLTPPNGKLVDFDFFKSMSPPDDKDNYKGRIFQCYIKKRILCLNKKFSLLR